MRGAVNQKHQTYTFSMSYMRNVMDYDYVLHFLSTNVISLLFIVSLQFLSSDSIAISDLIVFIQRI